MDRLRMAGDEPLARRGAEEGELGVAARVVAGRDGDVDEVRCAEVDRARGTISRGQDEPLLRRGAEDAQVGVAVAVEVVVGLRARGAAAATAATATAAAAAAAATV